MLDLSFAPAEISLSVRGFLVEEGLSTPFRVVLVARSPDPDLDLDALAGKSARFTLSPGLANFAVSRSWSGVCADAAQVRVETSGLSTYELTLVPRLWLLGHRRNHRLFQHLSIPDIVDRLLAPWNIQPDWHIARDRYPVVPLRVQHGETDLTFFCRLLEEAGITFRFADDLVGDSRLELHDAPQAVAPRALGPLPFVDDATLVQSAESGYGTRVRIGHGVRQGRRTLRDFDFRRPRFTPTGSSSLGASPEDVLEHYEYRQAASLVDEQDPSKADGPGALPTPAGDDQGASRHDDAVLAARAERELLAHRGSRRTVSYHGNAFDLAPGTVFAFADHPRSDLAPTRSLLVTHATLSGSTSEEWTLEGRAVFTDIPYRPPLVTPKPVVAGPQTATVVGPPGQEIHTDEMGRVRVQFHWDREGHRDQRSSVWLRVSQGWAGAGYGMFTLPRVGQEVLVAFLEGDPDSPFVAGRVFNSLESVPYKLPENQTVSTWKSASSPGGAGSNEIRFEDAVGREHLYMQAERDLDTLVKHDEMRAVGGDASRVVHGDVADAVAGDRTRLSGKNEIDATGFNRVTTVGLSRSATVGHDDSALVGGRWSVTMARGLSGELAREIDRVLGGPLGAVVRTTATAVLGVIPHTPLGTPGLTGLLRGTLSRLRSVAPESLRNVLGTSGGWEHRAGPPPTSLEMVDRKITLTTGEASIILDGPNISIVADGNIAFHARGNVAVLADGEAAVVSEKKALLLSRDGDVVVQAGHELHLNPFKVERPTDMEQPPSEHDHTRLCPDCGARMVRDTSKNDGSLVCERAREGTGSGLAPFRIEDALAFGAKAGEEG